MENKRKKAWVGALISGLVSVGSAIGGSLISKNAQEKAAEKQARLDAKIDSYEMAANLSQGYGDQSYADEFQKKLTFKNGGMYDRVKYNKKYSYSNRKKADLGAEVINAGASAASNLISSAIMASGKQNYNSSLVNFANEEKTAIEPNDYQNLPQSNYINNVLLQNPRMYKCGGRYKRK